MLPELLPQQVVLPVSLYQSLLGRYFVGYADNMEAAPGLNTWASLYNPPNSNTILHVNVITVTNVVGDPFDAEYWLNATFPGQPIQSNLISPSNTALCPLPIAKSAILLANNVPPVPPVDGSLIYSQMVFAKSTIVEESNGKYLIPPGGSFGVYLNLIKSQTTGRVAFGWWEVPIDKRCHRSFEKRSESLE